MKRTALAAVVLSGLLACLVFLVSGDLRAESFFKNTLNSSGVDKGMTRTQVTERYGDPDMTRMVISDDWEGEREEWFYRARMDILPINAGYLSKDMYLYFDEDRVTNISSDPIGKDAVDASRDTMK